MGEEKEAANTRVAQESITKVEEQDENTLKFLDSVDDYLVLIETLSSTLRQGWLEIASARHSMGASRVNTALLNLKHHSAATTVEINYHDAGSMTKSPQFALCKWASSDKKDSSSEQENVNEDEQSKENCSSTKLGLHGSHQPSENQENSRGSDGSEASPHESNGSEISASPHRTDSPLQKERAKVLSMFGTLVSPKLRASQLSFETALETLVEIANARSSMIEAHEGLQKEMKNTKG